MEASSSGPRDGEPQHAELCAEPLGSWFEISATKMDHESVAILFQDITERKRHERERELMVRELNHRVKNMLAVVQSIASQTLRTTPEPVPLVDAFRLRVQALGRAHDVLTQEQWRGSGLRELAEAVLGGFVDDGKKLRFEGPAVRLSPSAAISLAIELHELGTNALKHGALSSTDGKVGLSWELADESVAEEG